MNNIFSAMMLSALLLTATTAAYAATFDLQTLKQGGKAMMLFVQADSNGDGLVSEAEALAVARQQFRQSDANNDGQLSIQEVTQAQQRLRETRRKQSAPSVQVPAVQ